MRFELCSTIVSTTSSPGRRLVVAKVLATRFIPSVVPRTKMISLAAAAFTNLATVSRAAPSRCAARAASAWTGEGLALSVE
jgi:hypothetical protein